MVNTLGRNAPMGKKFPAQLLEEFFDALSKPNRRTGSQTADSILDNILVDDWAFSWQLDDLLLSKDSRIHRPDIEGLTSYFDIPKRYICRKPRFLNAGSMLHEGFAIADAAALLIRLEEIGFDTEPQRLVQAVLPTISTASYVTDSELLVMEYERHKGRSHVVLRSDANDEDDEWIVSKLKDSVGRRLEFTRVGGHAYRLEVRGPRYRSKPEPKTTTCEYCGCRYTKGDLESALAHRSQHANARRLLDPSPLPAFAERVPLGLAGERVDAVAPKWMHRAVYERARRFKSELKFDFLQWEGSADTKNTEPASCGYLFGDHTGIHPPGTIVGACAFWKDECGWRMRWVWVCPKVRRSGILANRWPQFLHLYGDFEVEKPYSEEMRGFLTKHGTPAQQAALRDASEAEIDDLPMNPV